MRRMVQQMLKKRFSFLKKTAKNSEVKSSGSFSAPSNILDASSSASLQKVRAQYEQHPYPAQRMGHFFSKPDLFQSHVLAYEWGQFLRTGRFIPHTAATRILVAGSGTFEPLVVCRAHPHAEVTALDISERSLKKLRWRARLQPYSRGLKYAHADLHQDQVAKLGQFDYILCTGVLHHSDRPEQMLKTLRALLKPQGILRLMMYPQHSRYWIYELIDFFLEQGLGPHTKDLPQKCVQAISKLSPAHPLRTSFENYADAQNSAGLIDGFFHAHDTPVPWNKFQSLCHENSLSLMGFGHAWHSQPGAFENALAQLVRQGRCHADLLQAFKNLNAWQRIEFLDLLHELSVNPVFWLSPELEVVGVGNTKHVTLNPVLRRSLKNPLRTFGPRVRNAPLMQPSDSQMLYAQERVYTGMADTLSDQDRERWITGGWLLGTDGLLPRGLFVNRAPDTPLATLVQPQLAPLAQPQPAPAAWSSQAKPQSSVRALHIRRALDLWLGDKVNELSADAVNALLHIIEPRIDRNGTELPELSLREELTRLQHELR